jgi:hypothetical protein
VKYLAWQTDVDRDDFHDDTRLFRRCPATDERIELTQYLARRDGRPAPKDTRAHDIGHWQTTLSTENARKAVQKFRATNGRMISPGVVAIPDKSLGFMKGFLARDPDGHGLQVIER